MTKEDFIKKYFPIARTLTKGTGIFPETVITQAILESSHNGRPGESMLSEKAKNLFGVKATKSWTGKVYDAKTDEYYAGSSIPVHDFQHFRAYTNFIDSIKDYIRIVSVVHTAPAKQKTIAGQMAEISKFYATDPSYLEKLKKVYAAALPTIQKIKPVALTVGGLVIFGFATYSIYQIATSVND